MILNFADSSKNKIPIPVKPGFWSISETWFLLTQAYIIVRCFGIIW